MFASTKATDGSLVMKLNLPQTQSEAKQATESEESSRKISHLLRALLPVDIFLWSRGETNVFAFD